MPGGIHQSTSNLFFYATKKVGIFRRYPEFFAIWHCYSWPEQVQITKSTPIWQLWTFSLSSQVPSTFSTISGSNHFFGPLDDRFGLDFFYLYEWPQRNKLTSFLCKTDLHAKRKLENKTVRSYSVTWGNFGRHQKSP